MRLVEKQQMVASGWVAVYVVDEEEDCCFGTVVAVVPLVWAAQREIEHRATSMEL